jgi:MazG nucleotide pyrophosphohydrolase domain
MVRLDVTLAELSVSLKVAEATDPPGGAPMTDRDSLARLQPRLRGFAKERSWAQFHTPKNLTTALAGEAGELAAVLQWATPDEDLTPYQAALEEEVGDVLI